MNFSSRRRWLQGPLAGILAGWLLALVALVWANDDFIFKASQSKILASAFSVETLTGPLGLAIARFLLALLALHGLLGLLAWALGRVTAAALPEPRFPQLVLTAVWLLLLAAWTWLANAVHYPASKFAPEIPWELLAQPGRPGPVIATAGMLIALAGILAFVALIRLAKRPQTDRGPRLLARLAALVLPLAAVGTVSSLTRDPQALQPPAMQAAGQPGSPPSIILIGLDSVRCDLSLGPDQAADMPNVREFLAGAHRFSDATTPLARTFPSWVSILTGRHPVTTGARVNLTPRGLVRTEDTLPSVLRAQGYTTVYATDEVRFANIDASYGFDHVVTPPIGAADFLLGKLNDLPLSNLLSPTAVAEWLFPHTYGNRAAHVTYRPESFEDMLDEELPEGRPLFLALHLTLAHWPYNFAGQPYTRTQPKLLRNGYETAVAAADAQFGRVIQALERRGVLDNAIVVLLSDHGEGMGWYTESLLQPVKPMHELWGSLWGHGTSVMTPHQFQVLLAFRTFGAASTGGGAVHGAPASLEDVRPTVLDLAGIADADVVDGLSLASVVRGEAPERAVVERVRFTETDFNTPSMLEGKYDEKGALSEAGMYYEVDPATGWVQLRAKRIGEIVAAKERAAFDGELLLAALPRKEAGGHQFLLTSRRQPFPMTLHGRPDPAEAPRAARLWDALHHRFPGEL